MATSEAHLVEGRRVVSAAPDIVFTVVTTAVDMTGWLSDEARCEARPGGVYELRWNSGYAVHGEVKAVTRPTSFSVTWHGTGEPGATTVMFALIPVAGGTEVTVRQSGFGRGQEWEQVIAESRRGWDRSLENLQHVVETGVDLREARLPILGIDPADPQDADRVAWEGIDTTTGIYLAGVADGSSAQAAGLRAGDVITSVDGAPVPGFAELLTALQRHTAGDRVDVSFVRGTERRTVVVELMPRPMSEVPSDPEELLAMVREAYQRENARIAQEISGISDERADRPSAEGEWSVKEVIAHLSVAERDVHYQVGQLLIGEERLQTSGRARVPEKLAAALATAPTVAALLNRLARDQADTLALLASLRPEIVSNKARYHRIGQRVLELPDHLHEHAEQIKAVLAAA